MSTTTVQVTKLTAPDGVIRLFTSGNGDDDRKAARQAAQKLHGFGSVGANPTPRAAKLSDGRQGFVWEFTPVTTRKATPAGDRPVKCHTGEHDALLCPGHEAAPVAAPAAATPNADRSGEHPALMALGALPPALVEVLRPLVLASLQGQLSTEEQAAAAAVVSATVAPVAAPAAPAAPRVREDGPGSFVVDVIQRKAAEKAAYACQRCQDLGVVPGRGPKWEAGRAFRTPGGASTAPTAVTCPACGGQHNQRMREFAATLTA
jgi:hypothetical protein